MVINKMSFAPKRDDRIQVYLSVLESLVSMLNGDQSSRHHRHRGPGAKFQTALRKLVDEWIRSGKVKREEELSTPRSYRNNLRQHLGDDGVAQFSLDFSPKDAGVLRLNDYADRWFRLFLNTDGQNLLSKCEHCDQYFLRKRLPKSTREATGIEFCAKHKAQFRVLSNKRRREAEQDRRIEEAAELAAKWTPNKRTHWKKWVAQEFNRNLKHYQKRITPAWITRHGERIRLTARKKGAGVLP